MRPAFLRLLHQLRMAGPLDLLLLRRAIEFRMNVETTQLGFFFLFDYERMRLGIGILTHARDLPGNFYIRNAGADKELVIFNLASNDGLRELADHGQLIAEVAVFALEPVG